MDIKCPFCGSGDIHVPWERDCTEPMDEINLLCECNKCRKTMIFRYVFDQVIYPRDGPE